ncbi:MAG TPA: hypothetical protein VMT91_14885 [Anaerolineales bacterium]|nr:hypothetical protein [Anaerolineales bacterium]
MPTFHEYPTAVLENDTLRVEYLTTGGPRIVGLSYRGSPNLLADVADIIWDTPYGPYYPMGGHRLWIAPEYPEKTYIPDHTGLSLKPGAHAVELDGASEVPAGVRKSVRMELDPAAAKLRLEHTITNESASPQTFAPWAITQFRQGGTVILPQPTGNTDPHGLLSNRLLVLWPYTCINEKRLVLRDDFILIHAEAALPPLKVGYASSAGWLAYWWNGVLFRKSFDLHPGAAFPDGGCNAESYCGDRFVELETLGVLGEVAPGGQVHLTETWELYPGLDVPFLPAEIRKLL